MRLPRGRKSAPKLVRNRAAGLRHLAAVLAEDDVPVGGQRIGDRDADLARHVVVAGAREAQRVIADRTRLIARRNLDGGDRDDAFDHPRHQRRRDAVVAIAPLLGDGYEPRLDELDEMLARGRPRDAGEKSELAAGQRLPAHQGGEDGGARGIPDERRNLDQICGRDHEFDLTARPAPSASNGSSARTEPMARRQPAFHCVDIVRTISNDP